MNTIKIPPYFDIKLSRTYSEEEQYFDDSITVRGDKMGLQVYCYKDEEDNQYFDIKMLGGREEGTDAERLALICNGEIKYLKRNIYVAVVNNDN